MISTVVVAQGAAGVAVSCMVCVCVCVYHPAV